MLDDLTIPLAYNIPLGPYTSYGLGGRAKYLAQPADENELAALIARCQQKHIHIYVLGRGANLLVEDGGVDGLVIKLSEPYFCNMHIEGALLTVGAGYDLMKLVLASARAGLGGLEHLAGIPATVGGAVRMNAGGAFGDIGTCVSRVKVMDDAGQTYHLGRGELVFGYRQTNITARFILEVEFELLRSTPRALGRRVKEVFFYKKQSQPLAAHSPGCAFNNPAGVSAGKLIDDAGLKGYRCGGAWVSDRHANFIIADENACSADVLCVIEHIERTVAARFDVKLEREVVIWP